MPRVDSDSAKVELVAQGRRLPCLAWSEVENQSVSAVELLRLVVSQIAARSFAQAE